MPEPKTSYVPFAFAVVTYAFFLAMLFHVWKQAKELKQQDRTSVSGAESNRGRWLSTLILGSIFGYVVECSLSAFDNYVYPEQPLCTLLPNFIELFKTPPVHKPVPLWVALGWGVL